MSRCGSLCGFGWLQAKGRRQKGGARSWWASFRDDRDHDDGGQDAEGEGADQHRQNFCGSGTDLHANEPSDNAWLDLTGAHQHHQLDHLIHLVAHLEQVEFGDLVCCLSAAVSLQEVAAAVEPAEKLPPAVAEAGATSGTCLLALSALASVCRCFKRALAQAGVRAHILACLLLLCVCR